MRITILHFIMIAAALLFSTACSLRPYAQVTAKVVAYVPNWIDLTSFSETIDYAKITHINIAFENPSNDEGDLSFNSKDDILIAKSHANHVQALISIGGGSASSNKTLLTRYADLMSDAKRAGFAAKLADYIVAHNADGLDVDIEGPAIDKNYGAFIQELADVLKPRNKLLTAALSQGYGGSKVPSDALKLFDFVNIMAYDGAGYWNPKSPGQHSSLDFAKNNARSLES
jgi:GH18 family chitinase